MTLFRYLFAAGLLVALPSCSRAPSVNSSVKDVTGKLSLREVAKIIATEIDAVIQKKQKEFPPEKVLTVAVLQFGNLQNILTPALAGFPKNLQLAIFTEVNLLAETSRRYQQKTPGEVVALAKKLTPADIDLANPAVLANAAKKLGVDVLVVGTLAFNSAEELEEMQRNGLSPILPLVVFAKDGAGSVTSVDPVDAPISDVHQTGGPGTNLPPTPDRLVTFSVKSAGASLPMLRCKKTADCRDGVGVHYKDVFFMKVPGSLKGKEYSIEVKRQDTDPALIGAAVMIDGVNSIYEDQSPKIDLPVNVRQWIMGPKGKLVTCNDDGSFNLVNAQDEFGHAKLEVKGFQVSNTSANAFTFVENKESVAALLGQTDGVGLISVHFFRDRFQEDKYVAWKNVEAGQVIPEAGTNPGRPLSSHVCRVKFTPETTAKTAVKILYRFDNEAFPLPDSQLEVVTPRT